MSSEKVSIDQLDTVLMDQLEKYAKLATDDMKDAVKDAGKTVRSEIQANAPVKTGAYRKSWTVTKQAENSHSIDLVVHSSNRYQIAHLLEKGYAKRNGGRVAGRPHIKPAEEKGKEELVERIERALHHDA